MHSLEEIKRQNREAGREAKGSNKIPISGKRAMANPSNIPNIGDHVPAGFTETETFFVDNSGFGSDSEPALTTEQFFVKVKNDHYYAITSVGQFQVYITEYK